MEQHRHKPLGHIPRPAPRHVCARSAIYQQRRCLERQYPSTGNHRNPHILGNSMGQGTLHTAGGTDGMGHTAHPTTYQKTKTAAKRTARGLPGPAERQREYAPNTNRRGETARDETRRRGFHEARHDIHRTASGRCRHQHRRHGRGHCHEPFGTEPQDEIAVGRHPARLHT